MSIAKKSLSSLIVLTLVIMAMIMAAPLKVKAEGEFKCKDAGNALNFDASNCPGTAIYEATKEIVKAESSNESVFEVNIGLPYKTYTEEQRESDADELGPDGQCEIVPMGPGTATLTLTDDEGKTIEEEVIVDEEYFDAYLNSKKAFEGKKSVGMYHYYDGEGHYTDNKIAYGDPYQTVYSRYGTKVTLKLKGKTYKGTTDHSHTCLFKKVKSLYKLKTEGTLILEFGPAKIKKKVKIASDTDIYVYPIKPNAKSGKAEFQNLHKGDVITIKVGGKKVKTVKIKKNTSFKVVKFKSKKKMKIKTKVEYLVKNKYKQTMKKKTYKVHKRI